MRISLRAAALAFAILLGLAMVAEAQWTWTPQTGRWVNIKRMPKETAELQLEYARSLMLEGDYKKALHEVNKFAEFYGDDPLADQNQFLRAEIYMADGKLYAAAKEFQQVLSAYPATSLYDDTIAKQYEIGDRFYELGQAKLQKRWTFFRKRPLRRAIEVYAMVIDNQPFTEAAAEAQYKLGLCHHTRGEHLEAAYEYRRVIEDYAGSEWVDEASHGLATAYYDQSLPPDYDQMPSQLAIEAIDSFTVRFPNDGRGAELGEKRQEMRNNIAQQRLQSARFYEKRRQFVSARIYYEVVVKQFPDTPAKDEAQAWLEQNPDSGRYGPKKRRMAEQVL